jgi:hypothetical protein
MITGAHIMIQSRNDKADQEFFTKVLGLSSVDAGNNFLIFAGPPAEIAIHESDKNNVHEYFLICDDIEAFVAEMKKRNVGVAHPTNRGWGTITHVVLPGGGKLQVYQPHHKRPHQTAAKPASKKSAPAKQRPAKAKAKPAAKPKKKAAKKSKRR